MFEVTTGAIPNSGIYGTYSGNSLYISSNACGESKLTETLNTNMNKVQINHVGVFKIERNDKNEITSAKFIKELWIETKNGSSIDFEVAKDPEISKYKADEISIRTILSITF